MKVLIIANGYSSDISGGDTHNNNLANYLVSQRIEVAVILPKAAFVKQLLTSVRTVRYFGVPFERHIYKSMPSLFFLYLYRIFASTFLQLWITRDVTIFPSHLFHDVIPMLFMERRSTNIVYVHHIISEQSRGGLRGFITRNLEHISFAIITFKRAKIIAVSPKVITQLCEIYKFPPEDIYLSGNGVSIELIESVQPAITEYDLVYCGRLVRQKGIFEIPEIVRNIKKRFPTVRCAILGSGPEALNLKQFISAEGLSSHVDMLGHVSESQKIAIIKAAKIFILPSYEEGWGIVIAEALACGTPVVAYGLEEITSIWTKGVEWIPLKDSKAFADNCSLLLTTSSLALSLGQDGKTFVEKYDWPAVLYKEKQLLQRIFADAKKKSALLLGSYGRGNVGDDVFLYAFFKICPNIRFTLNVANRELLPHEIRDKVHIIDTAFFKDFFRKMLIFLETRYVIYGGGDLWVELYGDKYPRKSLYKMLIVNAVARLFGKKVVYIGCGAGDIHGFSKLLARCTAVLANHVFVRDAVTHATLGLTKARVVPDLASCIVMRESHVPKDGQNKLHVAINLLYDVKDHEIEYPRLEKRIIALINNCLTGGHRVTLIPFYRSHTDPHDDVWVAKRIQANFDKGSVSIYNPTSSIDVLAFLKTVDIVFAARLHACIISVLLGIPTIGLSYRPKVLRFFSEVKMQEYCYDAYDEDVNLLSVFENAVVRYGDISEETRRAGDDLRYLQHKYDAIFTEIFS